MSSVCKTRGSASIWTPAVACRASDWSGRSRNGSEGASVWSELRERVAQYDSRTSDMRLRGGGASPSVEAPNHRLRGENFQCVQYSRSQTIRRGKQKAVNVTQTQSLRDFSPPHLHLISKAKLP